MHLHVGKRVTNYTLSIYLSTLNEPAVSCQSASLWEMVSFWGDSVVVVKKVPTVYIDSSIVTLVCTSSDSNSMTLS